MKHETFWKKATLRKYCKKNCSDGKNFYTILNQKSFFLFFEKTDILFYNQKDVETKVIELLRSIIEVEFNIKINRFYFDFLDIKNETITINLFTSNNSLIVGKFGQNQKSLELLVYFFLINTFKKKYKIKLNFPNYQKNFKKGSGSLRLSQKKHKKNFKKRTQNKI